MHVYNEWFLLKYLMGLIIIVVLSGVKFYGRLFSFIYTIISTVLIE